jgi:hypothetical protein
MTIEVTLGNIEKLLEVIAKNTAPKAEATPPPAAAVVTPIKPARAKAEKPAATCSTPAPAAVVEEEEDFLAEDTAPAVALTKDDVRASFLKLQNGRPDGKNQVYAVLKQFGAASLGTLAVEKYSETVAAVEALLAAVKK